MIERDNKWIEVASKLKTLQDKIKFLDIEKKKLSKLLQELSEFKDSCGGGFTYKAIERIGTINYKDIPELKDIDLSPYRSKPINIWRLSEIKQFTDIL